MGVKRNDGLIRVASARTTPPAVRARVPVDEGSKRRTANRFCRARHPLAQQCACARQAVEVGGLATATANP